MARYVIQKHLVDENIARVIERSDVPIIGVVKADGYGFGMGYMAQALKDHGIRMFAITEIADTEPLRAVVGDDDVLVMRSSALPHEVTPVIGAGCIATIGSADALRTLSEAASALDATARAHVKVDTGFSRYGFDPSDLNGILACFAEPHVRIEGMYTHFSKAYADLVTTKRQLDDLKSVAQAVRDAGFDPGMLHAANSPALFNFAKDLDVQLDAVRIGSAFTGRVITLGESGLARVGYLAAEVMDIKELPEGSEVGYGGAVRLKRRTRMAFASAGMRDGFGLVAKHAPSLRDVLSSVRHLHDGPALTVHVAGKACPVIGEPDLSTCYVDVTDASACIGDEVRLDPNPLMVPASVPREYE